MEEGGIRKEREVASLRIQVERLENSTVAAEVELKSLRSNNLELTEANKQLTKKLFQNNL